MNVCPSGTIVSLSEQLISVAKAFDPYNEERTKYMILNILTRRRQFYF